MDGGRKCQLAQLSGDSPFASKASILAPASSNSRMASSSANAAARCSGVSPLVRQSRMKPPVSTPGVVAQFGFAPCANNTCTTRLYLESVSQSAACKGVSPVPVKASAVKAQVAPKRLHCRTLAQQEFHRAYIAVIGAPLQQRHSSAVCLAGGISCRHKLEHQVRASVDDLVEQRAPA